ncbi:metal ABC transporter solute-binding protein, Zn/Mn family [Hoylesella oralis]|uniref:metal ABC transporter solute-binding protein, Zn/Mn family n=1 Tax=Hoylesella oralis TaxID=28134 RepID=UPI003620E74D
MNKNIGFFTVLTALLIAACTGGSPSDKRIITVTIEPLRYFTEQIAGDKFTVKTMVPRGGNPETYEPTARQMVDLSASDLYIKVGNIGFERTWMKRLEANAPHTIIINSSDGITSPDNSMYIHDPHTWMSTANAMYIARNIYKALAEIDSKDSLYFKKNLERLMGKIETVDTQIREEITKDKSTTFLIYHPALTYFAQEYGLRQLSIEEDGRKPSAVQLKQVINTARQNHVKIIFIQREFDSRNTDIVARSTGAEKVEINPLSYDWDKEMVKIAQSLK